MSVKEHWFVHFEPVRMDLVEKHSQHDETQEPEHAGSHGDPDHCLVLLLILIHYINTSSCKLKHPQIQH